MPRLTERARVNKQDTTQETHLLLSEVSRVLATHHFTVKAWLDPALQALFDDLPCSTFLS